MTRCAGDGGTGQGDDLVSPPGLLARSMLASVLVAAVAIVATAVLTADAARTSVERERVRVADVDQEIVERLVSYGRGRSDWSQAGPLLEELAASSERLIVITDVDGDPVATSGGGSPDEAAHDGDPAAVLDPLSGVLAAATSQVPRRFDSLALPAVLLAARSGGAELRSALGEHRLVGVCSDSDPGTGGTGGVPGSVVVLTACRDLGSAEGDDLPSLQNRVARREHDCLQRREVDARLVRLFGDDDTGQSKPDLLTVHVPTVAGASAAAGTTRAWRDCATSALTRELSSFVAPSAVLYVSETREVERSLVDRIGGTRIVVALVAVLGAVVVASLLASRRVLRPVRRLTEATHEMAAGRLGAQVPVTGHDEVAQLGRSFNEMALALAAADEQRKRMVSDVAHELRTPLSNLRGYLEAGHDGVLERDDAWTESLLEEVGLLQHMVDDLAVLAAADAGRLRLHLVEADVVATVEGALLAMRPAGDARDVSLHRTGAATAIAVHDPIRLRQVVANLVSNAVRHSPPGATVTVDVQVVAGSSGPSGVVVEVADEGEGLAEDDLMRVFERFYRADPSRTRETGGSGLGLSIVQQLAEAQGGVVGARNRTGRGAVFTVWLPAGTDV